MVSKRKFDPCPTEQVVAEHQVGGGLTVDISQ